MPARQESSNGGDEGSLGCFALMGSSYVTVMVVLESERIVKESSTVEEVDEGADGIASNDNFG